MDKIMKEIRRERKIQKIIIIGYAIFGVVLFSILLYCYFTIIGH